MRHWRKCRVVLSEYKWTVVWRGSDARRDDGTFYQAEQVTGVDRLISMSFLNSPVTGDRLSAKEQRTAVALEIATALNKRYATHLTGQINRMKTYHDWLVARKNSWTLRELQPRD